MTALASDWLRHYNFFSKTTKRNLPKLDRKQELNVLHTKFLFFGPIGKQDGRPTSNWLRQFCAIPLDLLTRIRWKLTRSNFSMSSTNVLFLCRSKNKDNFPDQFIKIDGILCSGSRYVAPLASCLFQYYFYYCTSTSSIGSTLNQTMQRVASQHLSMIPIVILTLDLQIKLGSFSHNC